MTRWTQLYFALAIILKYIIKTLSINKMSSLLFIANLLRELSFLDIRAYFKVYFYSLFNNPFLTLNMLISWYLNDFNDVRNAHGTFMYQYELADVLGAQSRDAILLTVFWRYPYRIWPLRIWDFRGFVQDLSSS